MIAPEIRKRGPASSSVGTTSTAASIAINTALAAFMTNPNNLTGVTSVPDTLQNIGAIGKRVTLTIADNKDKNAIAKALDASIEGFPSRVLAGGPEKACPDCGALLRKDQGCWVCVCGYSRCGG